MCAGGAFPPVWLRGCVYCWRGAREESLGMIGLGGDGRGDNRLRRRGGGKGVLGVEQLAADYSLLDTVLLRNTLTIVCSIYTLEHSNSKSCKGKPVASARLFVQCLQGAAAVLYYILLLTAFIRERPNSRPRPHYYVQLLVEAKQASHALSFVIPSTLRLTRLATFKSNLVLSFFRKAA